MRAQDNKKTHGGGKGNDKGKAHEQSDKGKRTTERGGDNCRGLGKLKTSTACIHTFPRAKKI